MALPTWAPNFWYTGHAQEICEEAFDLIACGDLQRWHQQVARLGPACLPTLDGSGGDEVYALGKALIADLGWRLVEFMKGENPDGLEGWDHESFGYCVYPTRTIYVRRQSPLGMARTIVHELAHLLTEADYRHIAETDLNLARGFAEVWAEGAMAIVLSEFGYCTKSVSLLYIAARMPSMRLAEAAPCIARTARDLVDRLRAIERRGYGVAA